MKTILIPNKYRTFNGVQRQILRRGRKVFLERQVHYPGSENEWINFIVRARLVEYNEGLMCDVELIPDYQPFESFKTEKEALKFFEAVEGGKIAL